MDNNNWPTVEGFERLLGRVIFHGEDWVCKEKSEPGIGSYVEVNWHVNTKDFGEECWVATMTYYPGILCVLRIEHCLGRCPSESEFDHWLNWFEPLIDELNRTPVGLPFNESQFEIHIYNNKRYARILEWYPQTVSMGTILALRSVLNSTVKNIKKFSWNRDSNA
jgi:hypothetical protein